MFKLFVFACMLAFVAANPDPKAQYLTTAYTAPLAYSSAYTAPLAYSAAYTAPYAYSPYSSYASPYAAYYYR